MKTKKLTQKQQIATLQKTVAYLYTEQQKIINVINNAAKDEEE
jgi:hypothetical protein